MGMLSIHFKPNFLGLFKILNNLNWIIVFFSLINISVCIYEDQIGKFDWRQTYVGRIKFAQFDTVSTAKKIIVATEENVLAALHLKTGQVVWRHVFESASPGNIQLLHVTDKVVTVTGANPYLVRGWASDTGVLLWEWSLELQNEETADLSEWWVQQGTLVHMLPVFGSHLEVTVYNLMTGQHRGASSKFPAAWTNEGCVLSAPYYSCVSGSRESQLLLSLDVTSNAVQIISKPLSEYATSQSQEGNLRPLDANSVIPGFIIDDKRIIILREDKFVPLNVDVTDQSASVTIVDSSSGPLVLQTWNDDVKGFSLKAHSVSTGEVETEIHCEDHMLQLPEPELAAVMCTKTLREQHVCRILVNAADDSMHLLQHGGRVLWSREEALANVVATEFVDLPVSELDAAIESEFDQKEGSIWGAFSRRLQTQFQQLLTLAQSVHSEGAAEANTGPLVRDYFNLHKIIVLVTDVGKIFGMDNLSGEILWKHYEPNLDTENVVLFTRRTARHPPHDAYITIIGKHEETGNGVIISMNPIRGTLLGERTMYLDTPLLQVALLHTPDEEKLHALLLLDKDENVQVLPVSASPLVENMYIYVAERDIAKVQGYALKYDGKSVVAEKTWWVYLGGGPHSGHRIVVVLPPRAAERVHSPGRVLPDRSVLYKHINPNLVFFITEGPDGLHKECVVSWCVDAVSGAVSSSQAHRHARAAPLAVRAHNRFAYVYYNDKHRRTEIATMELYEGKQRWVGAGGAFSSLAASRAPGVERAAFVLAASPTAAGTTVTERSLTDTHLILALSTGALVEVPWQALEARVWAGEDAAAGADGPLAGLAAGPLAPDVPLGADGVLNYNRSLHRVRAVHTSPAGLESTSLVLATGLDMFYTRVAPSKTFDLLKDDFDYYLITLVLGALVLASYSTKYFASRKMLKLAWK